MNERYNRFGVMMCSATGCSQAATHEVDCDSVVSYACLTHLEALIQTAKRDQLVIVYRALKPTEQFPPRPERDVEDYWGE